MESRRTHDWHAYPYRMSRKMSRFWMGIPLLLAGSFVILSAPSTTGYHNSATWRSTSTCTSKTPGSNWKWKVAWWCTVWASNSSSKCHLIWIYVSLVPKPWTLSYTYTLLIGQKIYNNWGLVFGLPMMWLTLDCRSQTGEMWVMEMAWQCMWRCWRILMKPVQCHLMCRSLSTKGAQHCWIVTLQQLMP